MNQPQALVTERPPVVAAESIPLSAPPDRCQECGSPMDRQQRYCINCAARRNDVSNPATRYFAATSRQRRQLAVRSATPPAGGTTGTKTAAVFFFALLPIAVAVGVIVGQNNSGGDDEALLQALRDGSATAAVGGAGAGAGTGETVSNTDLLSSDFSLDDGYTIMLDRLPIDGTDQAAADQAKGDAEDKGASDVGIINPGDYASTPDQGQENYILYSGEFKTKGEAEKALTDLKKEFPDAQVIGVKSSAAGGGNNSDPGGGGRVVAQTEHGTVHQVTTEPPSEEEIQESTDIVNESANLTGEDYTDAQAELPDVIPVGGDPEDAPPLPTGAGD
jgi:hypothetical protein